MTRATLLLMSVAVLGSAVAAHAANVNGLVTTTNGVPIPGIDLDVFEHVTGNEIDLLDDDTDADGNFDMLVPDGRYRIRFQPVAGLPLVAREFEYYALAGVVNWTVEMEVGVFVSGTVVGPGGTPIAGAEISATRTDTEADLYSPFDETDIAGAFSFVVPSNAPLELTIEPPSGTTVLGAVTTTGGSATNFDVGTIALTPGNRVTGRVVAGTGVARVNIDAFDAAGTEIPLGHDRTDSNGDFEIILPTGTFDLVARPRVQSGFAPVRVDAVSVNGVTDVGTWTVSGGSVLRGRVRSDAGVGVADVRLSVETAAGDAVESGRRRTNIVGDYEFVVPAGTYTVIGTAPAFRGFGPTAVAGVNLSGDATLDFALQPATPIRGVVSLSAERRAEGVVVTWLTVLPDVFEYYRVFRMDESGAREPIAVVDGTGGDPAPGNARRFSWHDRDARRARSYLLEARLFSGSLETEGPVYIQEHADGVGGPIVSARFSPNPVRRGDAVRIQVDAYFLSARNVPTPVTGRLVLRGAEGSR
jgi:hypothetical protein